MFIYVNNFFNYFRIHENNIQKKSPFFSADNVDKSTFVRYILFVDQSTNSRQSCLLESTFCRKQ